MTSTQFISLVLQILNEADSSINGAELVGSDATSLPVYITNLFPLAWRRAVKIFPRTWFNTLSFSDVVPVVDAPDGTGYVVLPADYLALSSFKMKGWKTSCLIAGEETPEINKKESNEYLRGTIRRPVCVLRFISLNNELRKALYYYSLPRTSDVTTHVVDTALYIPNITVLGANVDIDDNGIEALAYLTAATVMTSLEKDTIAKALESRIPELI